MNPRVFCVQKQHRQDPQTGDLVPKFDLTPAQEYGELRYLFSPTAGPFNATNMLPELHEKLRDYTPEDFLLLIGNPVLIGMAVAVAAGYSPTRVQLLQWSSSARGYLPIVVNGLLVPPETE